MEVYKEEESINNNFQDSKEAGKLQEIVKVKKIRYL